MTKKEWITAGMVCTFLVIILAFAFSAQPHAATRIGPETQISLADICPN